MSTLIKIHLHLIRNKITNIEKKYIILFIASLMLLLGLFSYVIYILISPNKPLLQEILTKYIFLIIGYVCIVFLPIEVYRTFIGNKEFDILFMAPLSLKECFGWNYLKKIVPLASGCIVVLILLIPIMIIESIHCIKYFAICLLLLLTLYTSCIFVEMLLYILLGNNLYKGVITIVGIEEIISFFMIMDISDGNAKWLEDVDFSILLYTQSVYGFMVWIVLLVGLITVSYTMFKLAYYKRGCCSRKDDRTVFETDLMGKIKGMFYVSKDFKVFIRNIDRMKYLIVTCMIYLFSTFIDAQTVDATALFVVILSFSLIIVFQFSGENIMDEKKTYDVLFMSGYSISEFAIQKMKFAVCNSIVVVTLYVSCLFVKNNICLEDGMKIGIIILPIILFSALYINFGCTIVFLLMKSENSLLVLIKLIIKEGLKVFGNIGVLLVLYVCLYFVKVSIKGKIFCWAIIMLYHLWKCRRIYNYYLKKELTDFI